MAETSISSTTFIVQYFDYYGHLITTGLSSPTISTIIPSITYSATYSQVATLLSQSVSTSTNPSGPVTLTALIDTASTTELQIVILPTVAASSPSIITTSGPQPSQTSQTTSGTSPAPSSVTGKSHSLSRGAIAGIAIGIALALIAILVLGFCVVRRRRRRRFRRSLRVPSERTNSRRFEKPELDASTSMAEVGVRPVQELPASGESNVVDRPGDGLATKLH